MIADLSAAERVVARCRALARVTDVEGQTTRTFLSPAMRRANDLVAGWMREAGLIVGVDAAGNLHGRTVAEPVVLLGSHLDTVVDAGAFDGPLGVILGIEAAAAMRSGPGLAVIGFSEEEGVRFGVPFLGSRALAGTLDAEALELRDRDGISVAEAIRGYGLPLDELAGARISPSVQAYLEVHIEQGPVLEAEDRAMAAVEAIAGQTRLRLRFEGQANHAGTTPMRLRRDALAAAAQWIVAVETEGLAVSGLVATVGMIVAEPGLGNVVPGAVTASLDVRHASDAVRNEAVAKLLASAHACGAQRQVQVRHEVALLQRSVAMDARLTGLLAECGAGAAMTSGAGHDAMVLAPHVPAAMLFVRSPGGISHSPAEQARVEDVAAALRITIEFLGKVRAGDA